MGVLRVPLRVCAHNSDWVKLYLGKKNGAHVLGCTCFPVVACVVCSLTLKDDADNEFTQLMKGLQGERLRQAFKYLDKDQDGYIRAEQFKKIILVCALSIVITRRYSAPPYRTLLATNCLMPS